MITVPIAEREVLHTISGKPMINQEIPPDQIWVSVDRYCMSTRLFQKRMAIPLFLLTPKEEEKMEEILKSFSELKKFQVSGGKYHGYVGYAYFKGTK